MATKLSTQATPGELDLGPPPRIVWMTVRGHIWRWLVIGVVVAIPVFMILDIEGDRALRARLHAEGGQQIKATVFDKWGNDSSYMLRYEFVLDGKTYRGRARISSEDAPRIGSIIVITYLPGHPHINRYGTPTADDVGRWGDSIFITAFLTIGISLVCVTPVELQIRRQRRLCRDGIAARGAVTERRKWSSNTRYIYIAADGEAYENTVYGRWTRRLNVGDRLTVLYDPEDPRISRPYEGTDMARIVS